MLYICIATCSNYSTRIKSLLSWWWSYEPQAWAMIVTHSIDIIIMLKICLLPITLELLQAGSYNYIFIFFLRVQKVGNDRPWS